MTYTSIYLIGFRGTGKSTIGKSLANRLQMTFIDMDEEIIRKTGKSLFVLTENGTNWETFRKEEHDVFQELLQKDQVVIGTGGGTMVNTIIDPKTGQTYGNLHTEELRATRSTLPILLTAADAVIEERIRHHEMKHTEIKRPILDEHRAKELQKKLDLYPNNPEKQKEINIDAIVEDFLLTYAFRKPLYEKITQNVVDTGKLSVEETVEAIISFWKG